MKPGTSEVTTRNKFWGLHAFGNVQRPSHPDTNFIHPSQHSCSVSGRDIYSDAEPLHLSYNHAGPGHYDALVQDTRNEAKTRWSKYRNRE